MIVILANFTKSFFFLSGFSFTDTDDSQDGRGRKGDHHLFHSTTSTGSRTFRHLFATLHVRWLSHIFNRIACIYQAATRWDLPPYRLTIKSLITISKVFDHYLQPHAKALLSYAKDTTDFINKLKNVKDTSKYSILVTMDSKALYTNILNHEDIEAVKETLNNQAKKPIATLVIMKFLYLILTLNNFVFSGINYISKRNAVPWVQFVHLRMQTFSWENLKSCTFTLP